MRNNKKSTRKKKNKKIETYGIEVNASMDIVVNVLGESDVIGGRETVNLRQRCIAIVVSSHVFLLSDFEGRTAQRRGKSALGIEYFLKNNNTKVPQTEARRDGD